MFDHKHYVPILKGKAGDFWALRNLKAASKSLITPVIEVVPPSGDSTYTAHLKATAQKIKTASDLSLVFCDLMFIEDAPANSSGEHVAVDFFSMVRTLGVTAVPVTSPVRSPLFQKAIQRIVKADKRGLAVRLAPSQWSDANQVGNILKALQNYFALKPGDIDLIVDFGSITAQGTALMCQAYANVVGLIPNMQQWRTVTIASGSFPASISQALKQEVWNRFARVEWAAWLAIATGKNRPARIPAYGDYAVGDPVLPYAGFAKYAVNLRYSVDADFFVWRGKPAGNYPAGNGEMNNLCKKLVKLKEYAGAAFSQGDAEIAVRAASSDSPGGPQQWRQWATSHYLELVAAQLSNHPGL